MIEAASDRFETVARVYDPSDLALLLSLFESEDIFVLPIGRLHAAVDPWLTTALGGVALRVYAEDAGDARLVLASLPPIPFRAPFELSFAVLILMLFLIGAAPPPPRQVPTFVLNSAAAPRREPYEG